MRKQANVKIADKSNTNYLTIGKTKLKLEKYTKGTKLETGRYVAVFYAKGHVKLLKTSQLLPKWLAARARFAGIGRQLIEVFTPYYGYGYNGPQDGPLLLFPGRFVFQKSTAYETTNALGWHLQTNFTDRDEELDFTIYMGEWAGPQPSTVQNRMTIEVHFNLLGQGLTLSINVNGAEVKYQIEGGGESKVLLYLKKPADNNYSHFNIKLKREDNPPSQNVLFLTRIERYSELYVQDDLGILENQL
jgi:hypothetical protein